MSKTIHFYQEDVQFYNQMIKALTEDLRGLADWLHIPHIQEEYNILLKEIMEFERRKENIEKQMEELELVG